jgi:hypothetical protein
MADRSLHCILSPFLKVDVARAAGVPVAVGLVVWWSGGLVVWLSGGSWTGE